MAMHGKTVLITGATNGIGLEAAVELARLGAKVVMVGRDPARTAAAVAEVQRRSGSAAVSHGSVTSPRRPRSGRSPPPSWRAWTSSTCW